MDTNVETEYRDALNFLFGRINFERSINMPYGRSQLKLDRMSRLLQLAGNPERGQKIIHIAGTKGKGSTSHFVNSILTSAGYRTGRFTSPHLHRVEERFAIDGTPCSSEDLLSCLRELRPLVEEMDRQAAHDGSNGPTYFELTTAIALLYFAKQKTDFTVLEVGLGGRLDSTNVCQPVVSIITSISFDHTRQLGFTLESIAREKAGIIKPGISVVSGITSSEADEVIEQSARHNGAPLVRLGRDFGVEYHPPRRIGAGNPTAEFYDLICAQRHRKFVSEIGSLGRHQAANAALAVAASGVLIAQGAQIEHSAMQKGLAATRCPARIEHVGNRPTVVLDTAHNVASIAALCDVLSESERLQPAVLIFASTRGKDLRGMLDCLVSQFDHIVCTRYATNPRGVPPAELMRHARKIASEQRQAVQIIESPTPDNAWGRAQQLATVDGLICVTGSFFIAAEIGSLHQQSMHQRDS